MKSKDIISSMTCFTKQLGAGIPLIYQAILSISDETGINPQLQDLLITPEVSVKA